MLNSISHHQLHNKIICKVDEVFVEGLIFVIFDDFFFELFIALIVCYTLGSETGVEVEGLGEVFVFNYNF